MYSAAYNKAYLLSEQQTLTQLRLLHPTFMGYKCCVANCKSGYSSAADQECGQHVAFFAFPYDPALREKWRVNCHRSDLKTVTNGMRACSNHFIDGDFVPTRKQKKLKSTAWSRLHPQLPNKEEPISKERSSNSSSKTRLDISNDRISNRNELMFCEDEVADWNEFNLKIDSCQLPSDYVAVKSIEHCTFLLVEHVHDNCCLKASVTVNRDLTFAVYINRNEVSRKAFTHVLQQDDKINRYSEVCNLLASVKSTACGSDTDSSHLIEVAASLIDKAIKECVDNNHHALFSFVSGKCLILI